MPKTEYRHDRKRSQQTLSPGGSQAATRAAIQLGPSRNARALTNVKIGNSVTSIGEWTFLFCTSLTNVTIPESVTSIADFAFEACTNLMVFTVDTNNLAYSSAGAGLVQ